MTPMKNENLLMKYVYGGFVDRYYAISNTYLAAKQIDLVLRAVWKKVFVMDTLC